MSEWVSAREIGGARRGTESQGEERGRGGSHRNRRQSEKRPWDNNVWA